MKGNEKVIGMLLGVLMSVVAGLLGLQSDVVKQGMCEVTVSGQK